MALVTTSKIPHQQILHHVLKNKKKIKTYWTYLLTERIPKTLLIEKVY